ncbi:unnamed protein product [Lymnaea stagnalis]|uniref:Uncharacterized protein n=1 Tax=Lymnaea stagnalis TaxID=6523 RepID=A0AAV2ICA4_LYMST
MAEVDRLIGLLNETAYFLTCQQFQTLKMCAANHTCNYEPLLSNLKGYFGVEKVICTPEGKEAILAYTMSECACSNVARINTQELMDACQAVYDKDVEELPDYCALIRESHLCILGWIQKV